MATRVKIKHDLGRKQSDDEREEIFDGACKQNNIISIFLRSWDPKKDHPIEGRIRRKDSEASSTDYHTVFVFTDEDDPSNVFEFTRADVRSAYHNAVPGAI